MRELNRPTNTGVLAEQHTSGLVQRILWQRLSPDQELLNLIDKNKALLLYPVENGENYPPGETLLSSYSNVVIIDGTWQESRKIYNKSDYLKSMPHARLTTTQKSRYNLRRNQIDKGLCTAECVIEVLKIKQEHQLALNLEREFSTFNESVR